VLGVLLGHHPIPEEWLPIGDDALDRYRLENSCSVNVNQLRRVALRGILEFSLDYTEKTVTRTKSTGSVVSRSNEGKLDQMMYSVAVAETDADTAFMLAVGLPVFYGHSLQGISCMMADGSNVLQGALETFAGKHTKRGITRSCFFHAVLQTYTTMYRLRDDDDDGGHGPMVKAWLRDILFCAQDPDEHRRCCSELILWTQAPAQQAVNPFWSELLLWVEHVLKGEKKLGNAFVPPGMITMYTQAGYNEADNNRFKANQGRQMATSLEMLGRQMGAMGRAAERTKVRCPATLNGEQWSRLLLIEAAKCQFPNFTLSRCLSTRCLSTRWRLSECTVLTFSWPKCHQH
jgi:hypothetical protein